MLLENPAYKTIKLKDEENMLTFLEVYEKVNYYYNICIIIIIDSIMSCSCHK